MIVFSMSSIEKIEGDSAVAVAGDAPSVPAAFRVAHELLRGRT
jgi:hypothetical protein